jgi:uncharacterized protein (TIGR02186 family)
MIFRFTCKFALLALLAVAQPAAAQLSENAPSVNLLSPMVADISQNAIEIRSDFNGTQLLIFGARNVPGDVVIAVRGPMANMRLRQKERIAGMWMFSDQRKYENLPLFYAVTSSKPLNRIAPPSTLQALGLGERRLIESGNAVADDMFDAALTQALNKKRWWQVPFAPITYFGESLFKARLELPDTLPSGHYTAEVYLFDRGQLLASQSIPVQSRKTGFDASIADAAKHRGLLYGLVAVVLALFGGWLGHRLFHRA